jgi:methyl-accepting chemotaxis protein
MARQWSFTQKVVAGFVVTLALTVSLGVLATAALRRVVASKDRVIDVDAQLLVDAQALLAALERKVASARGFLLTREERSIDRMREARAAFQTTLARLKRNAVSDEGRRLLAEIEASEAEHERALALIIALRRSDAALEEVSRAYEGEVQPRRDDIHREVSAFVAREEELLAAARRASTKTATSAIALIVVLATAATLFAALVAWVLTRALTRQVGSAVGHVQSSSAELQAAASQQATGAREQATAMSEISTTISELLATSRQIAESARRVVEVAEQTAEAARLGEGTVAIADQSIVGLKRQVEVVVNHMLELGGKSQQIGAVADIVSELAEQTNILAINATIEAAGAGEAGKRFAVVADEIRKLADRVAGSTKEIRTLIEDVRSSVHSTVMATETGSKAVEAAARQFGEVAAGLKRIAGLVVTTTEAAREIELSTKQQATAVEQVNVAVGSVAQATRETEASSGQTLQTASQLATLSRDLQRLVRREAAA